METKTFLQKIISKQDLTESEAFSVAEAILKGSLSQSQIAGFLIALTAKGESVPEIIGFVKAMRKHMLPVENAQNAIDVCGTGGDGTGTFNVSTAVAFVVGGAGVKVAKHGNRAASSNCGSADVLEVLGVNINLSPQSASEVLQKTGIAFLFAPIFHPAFRNVAPVRKELGVKTIFNYIGPFANPAGVKCQLIGVPNVQLAEKLADVAKQLDYEHLLIVTSEDGLDEISPFTKTIMFEVKGNEVKKKVIDPSLCFARNDKLKNLQGGSALENAEIIRNILSGEKGPKRDIVVLNSAYALYAAGKVQRSEDGIVLAEESIDSGSAIEVLNKLKKVKV